MSDPTSTSTLQQLVPYLLPERGQPGSTLTAPTDLAAVLVHAIHTSLEFRLVRPITPSGSRNQSADTEEQDDDEGQQRRGEDTEDTVSETETAVNDDQALQGQSSSSSLDTRFVRLATEARLPSGWNDRGEDSYTFTYKHEQSGLSFIVRVGRMGGRVNVSGMAEVSVRVLQAFVPFVLLRLMLSLLPSE
jgi:proteasome inhibitor subunit 1 (PI31)